MNLISDTLLKIFYAFFPSRIVVEDFAKLSQAVVSAELDPYFFWDLVKLAAIKSLSPIVSRSIMRRSRIGKQICESILMDVLNTVFEILWAFFKLEQVGNLWSAKK